MSIIKKRNCRVFADKIFLIAAALPIIISTVFTFAFLTMKIYAGMYPNGYFLWAAGEFEIPDEIKKTVNASELKPFLESKDTYKHAAAVRRLGEIEGEKAIDTLKTYLIRDTNMVGYDVGRPVIKLEAIRTLGRIGTEQAKSVLLDTLKLFWAKGPVLLEGRNKGNFYLDADFSYTVPELLKTLYKWSSDNDVFKMANAIALSDDVKNFYGGIDGIGQRAWEISLKGEILRKGITSDKETATYLMNLNDEIEMKGVDTVPFAGPKRGAIRSTLVSINDTVYISLSNEISLELTDLHTLTNNSTINERYKQLMKRIEYIKIIQEDKKENKEKLELHKKQVVEALQAEKANEKKQTE